MQRYDEQDFRAKVDAALERIRTILENTRNPRYPADVPHRYDDKYLLAEFVAGVSMASLLQCLELVGLSAEGLASLREWAKTRSVTLRLAAQEDCRFLREETRKVESAEIVTETRGLLGGKSSTTQKVVTQVTEYFWRFDFKYEIVAYQGNAPETTVVLLTRSGGVEIKTGAKTTPRPKVVARPPVEVNITWLLDRIDAELRSSFVIDRADKACHTPRRNRQIDAALREAAQFHVWCSQVASYFLGELFTAQQEHGRDLSAINDHGVFVPVVPLFEANPGERGAGTDGAGVLPVSYLNAFLAEERRSLAEKCRSLSTMFPQDASVITAVEAGLLVTLLHAKQVCQQLSNGVDYIEDLLRKQLIAAIGKEVTPADFNAYMEFHHRKLVKPEFRPQPFSHAIRRPDHYPEGVLSIEAERGAGMPDPISTTVAWSAARRPMSFALDASTRVSFLGDRFLHAWISHQFSGQDGVALSLVARARQFSSFILLVGRIASATEFEPRFGIIVQNKDLLKIPLMLEQIPTPKEFRDAIESLSPEQQRFARAFRGMQLESSMFGVCVVQIKPQLEKLLKLAPDSLTKEIRMTQELLSLFIEYQIPSDLLSYDGPPEASPDEKLARVKGYIEKMREMIDLSKRREIEEEQEREALRLAEANRTPPAPQYASFGAPPGMAYAAPMVSGGAAAPGGPRMAMEASLSRSVGGPPRPSGMAPGMAPPRLAMPAAAPPPPAPAAMAAPPREPARERAQPAQAVTHAVDTAGRRPAAQAVSEGTAAEDGEPVDYTKIPGELDTRFEQLDEDGALRATILHPGDTWTRTAQKGLLSAPTQKSLPAKEQKEEKNRAFDLLDALSKSGALPFEDASLHVVIAATHCFDRTLLETVIQDNVNPVEKVERSLMIVATTIHRRPAAELLAEDQRERFFTTSPRLDQAVSDVKEASEPGRGDPAER